MGNVFPLFTMPHINISMHPSSDGRQDGDPVIEHHGHGEAGGVKTGWEQAAGSLLPRAHPRGWFGLSKRLLEPRNGKLMVIGVTTRTKK